MARQEHDREDIVREAVALVERIELRLPNSEDPVVVGFRRDGSVSFYFGADPVLQFNTRGELRRGFDRGKLLKAERGRLVSLRRIRNKREVTLQSHDLSAEELASYFHRMLAHLMNLDDALRTGAAQVLRQFPADTNVSGRVMEWFDRLDLGSDQRELPIAAQPNAGSSS